MYLYLDNCSTNLIIWNSVSWIIINFTLWLFEVGFLVLYYLW
jgi:hypothetical protein